MNEDTQQLYPQTCCHLKKDKTETEFVPRQSTRAEAVCACWMLLIDLPWSALCAKVSLMVTPNCRAELKLISCNKAVECRSIQRLGAE